MKQATLVSFAVVFVVMGSLSAGILTAQQQQQAKLLKFEVAAIKPSNPKPGVASSSSIGGPGGEYRLANTPLTQWVEIALSVSDDALKAPSWLNTSRFDLDARMPAGETASAEMMKALLIERFGLKWHEETQSVSGYELVTEKKVLVQSSSMQERLQGRHGSSSGSAMIGGTNMPMSELAEALGKVLGRPVVDATNLSGGFDIKLRWRPDNAAVVAEAKQHGMNDVNNLPSITTAVREQLGLRLQSTKVPSNVIVVDRINQPTHRELMF